MGSIYNALICDEDREIVARTQLTSLKNVPWSWKVKYGKKEILNAKDLKYVLPGPDKPLTITRRSLMRETEERVEGTGDKKAEELLSVKFVWNGSKIPFKVKGYNTVEDLRFMAARQVGTVPPLHGLSLDGTPLRYDWCTMADLGVSENRNMFQYIGTEENFENSSKLPPSFGIKVATLTGKTIHLQVRSSWQVGELKTAICEKEGIPNDQQRLIHVELGVWLEDGRWLSDYAFEEGTKVCLVLRLRGGGGLEFGNLEGKLKSGVGKTARPEDYWKSFQIGLNLKGNCENKECKSRAYAEKDLVMYNFGFGAITLSPFSRFPCPACDLYTFKPEDFLVCGANSAFRFRPRAAGNNAVKTRSIGSGPFPEYVELEDGGEKVQYEFIEVYTEHCTKSVCGDCAICGEQIIRKEDEVKSKTCCHYFHKYCVGEEKRCLTCATPIVDELGIVKLDIMSKDEDNFM